MPQWFPVMSDADLLRSAVPYVAYALPLLSTVLGIECGRGSQVYGPRTGPPSPPDLLSTRHIQLSSNV